MDKAIEEAVTVEEALRTAFSMQSCAESAYQPHADGYQ